LHFSLNFLFLIVTVLDNSGLELVSDLILAANLLNRYPNAKVMLHAKLHPTFISDTTENDIKTTVKLLKQSPVESVQELGNQVETLQQHHRLLVSANPFWTFPKLFNKMTESLKEELSQSNLVVVKGDANYRRLVLDTAWEASESFQHVVSYFPAPVLALRTVKCELVLGVKQEMIDNAAKKEPLWMTTGNWGVIQFAKH
jgi:uncharacterized protein with ATP-grasp and redox domains